ncbi:MAG: hypothetical protein Ct9H300mP28_38010 [Pseudomonadota bacterium]|nr:MAG: hypothetical protein Ct9H300mP28_38010 [Pseudomonadota bacterium]
MDHGNRQDEKLKALAEVPLGHKLALTDIKKRRYYC